ncbi:hypothetical protein [Streptomyces mirabilis]|uniref:hypothetical protein n=1 Tax=Streptomyces mirabilis TaxID=68239 RepID=UPI0031BB53D6
MIDPSGIPQFTGDFDQLDKDTSGLRGDAIGIRNGGMDVHSRFQMLEAFYTAPEADDLFATTQPVMDKADAFAAQLETVADALDTYSIEARPLAKKLAQLKTDAFAFVDSVEGDDNWTYDGDKIHRHQELMDGVAAAESAFREAERRAATKISSLVGGPEFVVDDGHHTVNEKTVMYGYDLDVLKHAKDTPWGAPESESHHAWEVGYWAKSFFWDGLVIDNIWGGIKGLGTLVGWNGSDAAGDAWGHLGDVVSGIGQYTAKPYDALMDWAIGPDKESATEVRQKKAAKDFAKSMVAWDMWSENPARAAATVVFNGLTLGRPPGHRSQGRRSRRGCQGRRHRRQGRRVHRPGRRRPQSDRQSHQRTAQTLRPHRRNPHRHRRLGGLPAHPQRHRTRRRLQSRHQGRQVHPRRQARQRHRGHAAPGSGRGYAGHAGGDTRAAAATRRSQRCLRHPRGHGSRWGSIRRSWSLTYRRLRDTQVRWWADRQRPWRHGVRRTRKRWPGRPRPGRRRRARRRRGQAGQ